MAIVLDLETCAIDGAAALVKPAANLKDPEKIKASIAERAAAAGLYPYTARIVALGWCDEGEGVEHVDICPTEAAETRVLKEFVPRLTENGRLVPIVTFNGRRFDLPLLMVRCRLLGVPCPNLDIRKYYSSNPDVLDKLTFFGELEPRSLTWFAQRFGLPTDDAFTGALVPELIEDGNWDAIKAHCASDVRLTRLLAERLGVMRAPVFVGGAS